MKKLLLFSFVLASLQTHALEADFGCLEAFQAMGNRKSCREWIEQKRGEYTFEELGEQAKKGVCDQEAFDNLFKVCSNVKEKRRSLA